MNNIFSFFKRRETRRHFERLLSPHLPQLYRLSYRFTGKREDAEDLIQDLLIHLFPKVDEMRTIVNLKAWLSRCLYNHYVDSCRKSSRDPIGHLGEDSSLLDNMEYRETPDTACYQQQVLRLLNGLGDDDRLVVNLHDIEGYSIKEIEAITGMPAGTIKSRLHRARKKLRESLNTHYFFATNSCDRKTVRATGEQHEL